MYYKDIEKPGVYYRRKEHPHFGECLLFVLQVQLWFCGVLASVLLSECFDNDFDEIPNGLIQPLIIEDTHIQSLVPVM